MYAAFGRGVGIRHPCVDDPGFPSGEQVVDMPVALLAAATVARQPGGQGAGVAAGVDVPARFELPHAHRPDAQPHVVPQADQQLIHPRRR